MIRLLIADDHPIVLQGLLSLLATEGGMEVVESCRDGNELLEALERHTVDVVLLDEQMPSLSGISVLRQLAARDTAPACVLLTGSLEDAQALEAIRAGVRGIVLKEEAPRQLIETIRAVAAGERRVEARLLEQALSAALEQQAGSAAGRPALTPGEARIVKLLCRGMPNKHIARELGITEATVKIHLHRIFRKTDVRNRVQLTIYAQQQGLDA